MVLAGKHAEGNNGQMFHCVYLYMYVHIYIDMCIRKITLV